MLASTSSSTRCIAISRSRNSPSAVELIDAAHLGGSPRTTEPWNAMPISSDQPSHMPRPQRVQWPRPIGFAWTSNNVHVMFYIVKGSDSWIWIFRRLNAGPPHGRNDWVLSQLENGDELPNCFLERSRLGRTLPCAIRLRAQRSDHVAVGEDSPNGSAGGHTMRRVIAPRHRCGGLQILENWSFISRIIN